MTFRPVSFSYNNTSPYTLRPGNYHPPQLTSGCLTVVLGCPPYILESDIMSTFAIEQNVDVLSHATCVYLEIFWRGW